MTNITPSKPIQDLLDRASGLDQKEGDTRLKAVVRDLLEQVFHIIERHDLTEDEVWGAVSFLGKGAEEYGLMMPGVGIEHFMDLVLDARDEEAGMGGGTPRTIEGPLYVEGAPLSEGSATMSDNEDEGERLIITGVVKNEAGDPLPGAVVDVWHADTRGFYSHFDPTEQNAPFNNRRKIRVGDDGRFEITTIMPSGYACPPGGSTDTLMTLLGRHAARPAHVHFFADAEGYRHLTTQINIADDPLVNDDFAFGTRDGLAPEITREDGVAKIRFDLELVSSTKGSGERSHRERLTA
ncbi:catechol 1,2-dioxygenase [Oceanicola sp. D3]|uniref:dioxygenase family protein n=1 Tax=Oceanicola sp. D3 TaxID=2587163 RepID=UPI00111EE8A3|nr:dioxygenase [Oceanicola sp. D3]QDC10631.1 catechol 1,2-dioxygenase [Oceanicola sp. D3]